ncbi:MAG: hypothetical protein IJQ31_16180 [Thermoguttaceae bacterium]|nr:hypothetical protein [Thermoguttaceae bacterium]
MKAVIFSSIVLVIVVAIGVFQFGLFNKEIGEIKKQFNRQTVSARVEKAIEKYKREAEDLKKQAFQWRVEANKLREEVKKEQEEMIEPLEKAMKNIAVTAEKANLPKPSEIETMTEEQKIMVLKVGNKEIAAPEVYKTLNMWHEDVTYRKSVCEKKLDHASKLEEGAEKMMARREVILKSLPQMSDKVSELEMERELSALDRRIAELDSTLTNVPAGELGELTSIIEDEITENKAVTKTIQDENSNMSVANRPNPKDFLGTNTSANNELDDLWGSSDKSTSTPVQ